MNEVSEIRRHMTRREKTTASAAWWLYIVGMVACIFNPIPRNPNGVWKAWVAVIAPIVILRTFSRWRKGFCASTDWARANHITAHRLDGDDFFVYGAARRTLGWRKKDR